MSTWTDTGLTPEETFAMSEDEWQNFVMQRAIPLLYGRKGIKPKNPKVGWLYLSDDGCLYVCVTSFKASGGTYLEWKAIGRDDRLEAPGDQTSRKEQYERSRPE